MTSHESLAQPHIVKEFNDISYQRLHCPITDEQLHNLSNTWCEFLNVLTRIDNGRDGHWCELDLKAEEGHQTEEFQPRNASSCV